MSSSRCLQRQEFSVRGECSSVPASHPYGSVPGYSVVPSGSHNCPECEYLGASPGTSFFPSERNFKKCKASSEGLKLMSTSEIELTFAGWVLRSSYAYYNRTSARRRSPDLLLQATFCQGGHADHGYRCEEAVDPYVCLSLLSSPHDTSSF